MRVNQNGGKIDEGFCVLCCVLVGWSGLHCE